MEVSPNFFEDFRTITSGGNSAAFYSMPSSFRAVLREESYYDATVTHSPAMIFLKVAVRASDDSLFIPDMYLFE